MGTADVETFWRAYARHEGVRPQLARFRVGTELSARLIAAAAAGASRATFGPPRDFEERGDGPVPRAGDHAPLLDHRGRPRLIWRTTEVAVGPLCGVTDA